MAQMTVAAALGEECADDWTAHLADTLASGRGLCDENLAALLCRDAPARIREMAEWRGGCAPRPARRIAPGTAPAPSVPPRLHCGVFITPAPPCAAGAGPGGDCVRDTPPR